MPVSHACRTKPRVAQKVDPRAKHWMADAVAKSAAGVLLSTPAVPPTRKPAPPVDVSV